MCTYLTEKITVDGSGKGATGWFTATEATVYVDHPVHAPYGHTVNIDLLNTALGASARVALELTEETALALADAIRRAVASAPLGIASKDQWNPLGSGSSSRSADTDTAAITGYVGEPEKSSSGDAKTASPLDKSAPMQKAEPAPVSTSARTSSSKSQAS